MFLLHWVLVSCISPSISFLMLLFFPGFIYIYIYILSTKKIVKATLSRLLSSEFEESLTKPFIRWVVSRTYSGPWTTQPLTFTVVFVLWDSTENSPCKLNVFTNRYTVFVKWWDNMHDTLLFTPLKKLSHIVTQLISFFFEKSTNDFLYFDTSLINSRCFAPFAFCSGLSLQIRDKWTSNDSKTNLTKEISNLPWNTRQWPLLVSFLRIFFS